jgi:hypothetical protein
VNRRGWHERLSKFFDKAEDVLENKELSFDRLADVRHRYAIFEDVALNRKDLPGVVKPRLASRSFSHRSYIPAKWHRVDSGGAG